MNTCVKAFSLPSGAMFYVKNVTTDGVFSMLCQGRWAVVSQSATVAMCTSSPSLEVSQPARCYNDDGYCAGTNSDSQSFDGKCVCGYNPSMDQYCKPFLGDSVGQQFYDFFDDWLERERLQSLELEKHLVERGNRKVQVRILAKILTIYKN